MLYKLLIYLISKNIYINLSYYYLMWDYTYTRELFEKSIKICGGAEWEVEPCVSCIL